jgi:hypothetical protein
MSVAVGDYVQTALVADSVATSWAGSTVTAVNICRFTQFSIARTVKTDRLRLDVTTAASTGSLRMGICSDTDGRPGTVIAQGTVAWAAAMLEVTFTEVTLTPGIYWAWACAQHTAGSSSNPQYRASQRGQPAAGDPSPVAGATSWPVHTATISGAMTDNPGMSAVSRSTASQAPMIWLKVTALP